MNNFLRLTKDFLKKSLRSIKIHGEIRAFRNYRIIGEDNKNTFFGYYDKTPFHSKRKIVLSHVHKHKIMPLTKPLEIDIGFFDLNDGRFINISKTDTWCWQMGARLMWLPKNENLCVFNFSGKNKYKSAIINIDNCKRESVLSMPIYDLSSDGKSAVTLNFSRLHKVRPGYGYVNFEDPSKDKVSPSNDGIWLIDIKKNICKILLSLKQINQYVNPSLTKSNKIIDYVNHLRFSPDNKKLYFYYVWKYGKNNLDRKIYPLVYDFDSNKIKLITNENISHECWIDNNNLMLWSNDTMCYNAFNVKDGKSKSFKHQFLKEDGHPTFIGKEELLTDTYPNRMGYQSLLHFKDKKILLGKFYVPYHLNGEVRCDLHPRISNDKSKIAIDIFSKNQRRMCIIDLYE